MSFEFVNAFATLGTFLVIAATAIAAIVQLRHARTSNQIAALNELREMMEQSEFRVAQQFVITELPSKLLDPAFRYQISAVSARTGENQALIAKLRTIGNYYEGMGVLVKSGLVDPELALDMWSDNIRMAWERLSPVAAIDRRSGGDSSWENFEYVTVLAQDWIAAHPNGTYPSGVRRIVLKDQWLETDKQYAASLAPA
jgi:hypothetical protein